MLFSSCWSSKAECISKILIHFTHKIPNASLGKITKHTIFRHLLETVSKSYSERITAELKVIMWFICLFSLSWSTHRNASCEHQHSSFSLHWICMTPNANSQHECASTKDIWLNVGSTSPQMWYNGWLCRKWVHLQEHIDRNISIKQKKKGLSFCSGLHYITICPQWERVGPHSVWKRTPAAKYHQVFFLLVSRIP